MDDFLINTDYNNQKIMLNTSYAVDTSSGTGLYVFSHDLGYIPVVRVWYEPTAGQWRPLSTRQMPNSSPFSYLALTGTYSITTSTLEVEIRDSDNITPSCNIWVRVYYDD